jgi:hypothetical protein
LFYESYEKYSYRVRGVKWIIFFFVVVGDVVAVVVVVVAAVAHQL